MTEYHVEGAGIKLESELGQKAMAIDGEALMIIMGAAIECVSKSFDISEEELFKSVGDAAKDMTLSVVTESLEKSKCGLDQMAILCATGMNIITTIVGNIEAFRAEQEIKDILNGALNEEE